MKETNPDKVQVGGDHYKSKSIQPWEAMEAWLTEEQFKGYLRGNVIKYVARCDDKGGLEDLKKARHYLNKLIASIDQYEKRVQDKQDQDEAGI